MPSVAIRSGAGTRRLGGSDTSLLLIGGQTIRTGRLAVVAADMPGITTALIARLAQWLPRHQAIVPRTARGYHPWCTASVREVHVVVEQRLSEGQLDKRGLLDARRSHSAHGR